MAATPAPGTLNDTTDLSSLLPAYQQQYLSMAPAIERAVIASENARGMANSGQANDSTAKGLASLLATLSGESAGAQTQSDLQAKQLQAQKEMQSEQLGAQRSANTAQMISGGLGAGLGGLSTLAMLKYMKGGAPTWSMGPNGQLYNSVTGELKGATTAAPAAPGLGAGSATDSSWGGVPYAAGAGPAAPAAAAAAPTAGWQQLVAGAQNPMNYAAGAVGGLAGNQLGNLAFGKNNSAIGSAAGGLGGGALGLTMYGDSPWAALAGAGLGAFAGGGLGGLFK